MSHELEILDGKAQMFSGEDITPWHGMGNVIKGLATTDEALELSGLDWEVELRPTAFMGADGQWKAHKDRFSAVRTTDEKYLGNDLSKNYHIYQNRESFEFLNNITDTGSGEAVFSTAGSLFGGSRTFITLKLTDAFTVGDQDAHDLYLMCTNSHDGTASFTVSITPIRAVCNNTVTLGLREAKTKWSIKHKKALTERVQDARHILELGYKYEKAFEAEVAKLMEIDVTNQQFYAIVDKIVPAGVRLHNPTVDTLMDVWKNEPTVKMGGGEGNAWGAFNALTYYTDNVKEYRTDESRFNSIIGTGTQQGLAESLRPKMHKALLQLA